MATKLARLYLVNDILQNTTSKQSNLMSLKRGFVTHTHTHMRAHTCTYIHTCVRTHTCTYTRAHTCTYIHTCVRTHTGTYTRACTHAHAHTYTNTHAQIFMHTHAHAHTHTHLLTDAFPQCCSESIASLLLFPSRFEARLQTILEHFHKVHQNMESKSRAEAFRVRMCACTHMHLSTVHRLRTLHTHRDTHM